MRAVGLISGGKDSCYNMMQCVAAGHTIVALANLQPQHKDELDSYMYQTVGHQGIDLYAEAMGLPLYRQVISGVAVDQSKNYSPSDNDEVEDLYRLLSRVKDELDVEAVACGAILSDYQRIRVESVCQRLGLVSLAYLWRRNQKELLQEMIASGVEAIIIKVAALGLDPKIHLGMTLREIQPHLLVMQEKYGLNVCGEGGEYETFTLDCPLFCKRLVIDEKELVIHSEDPVASVGYLNLKLHLEPKEDFDGTIKLPPTVKNSLDFVNDLSDTVFSDISDIELSETELESIEKLEKEEQKKENELNPLLTYSGDGTDAPCNVDDSQNDSTESIEDGFDYDDIMHNESERQPILDHSSIYGNKHGWYFIGGIVGEGIDTATATEEAMKKLINLLESQELELRDVCSVNIYMRDMEDYADLNAIYARNFCFPNPPTRVCVQCPLPKDVGLIMDAVAHKATMTECDSDGCGTKERMTMHVQGISHWAPANIGPYSQAFKVGEVAGTCGQIALVPGSMRLAAGGPRAQCALALRHLGRLLRATHPRAHIRSVVQSVCYVTGCAGGGAGGARAARRQLERRTAGAIVQCAAVQALPRRAAVEWHAWAHTDNDRFDYEETGCNIGEYKVAITRRWNYENTIAAIVCSVATASSPSTCQLSFPDEQACRSHRALAGALRGDQLRDALHYALRKLLNDAPSHNHPHPHPPPARPARPALSVRIFYQVWSAPSPMEMVSACSAAAASLSCAVALTVVPVLALHNAFTFLSISGLRFDE